MTNHHTVELNHRNLTRQPRLMTNGGGGCITGGMHAKEPVRVRLANLPTPVVEMKNLARQMGAEKLLLKRDDLTGIETSGNKVRKLEYVIADAIARGADTLVTHGGFQSNHCRATAAIGARLALKVRLLLRSPNVSPEREGNLFFDYLFGAEVSHHSPAEYNGKRKELMEGAMEEQQKKGRKPYFFPVGASVPLGCWGYVRCVAEMVEQLRKETAVDVFVPVSSSGTYAGLVLGKALFGLDNWRMVGIPVSDSLAYFQKDVRELIAETVEQFGLGVSEDQTPLEFLEGCIGEGYAIPFPAAIETIKTVARAEGICLDPTYTGKAMTGFVDAARTGGVRRGALPVFVHTGGIFGLMARRDLF
jgi:D-cysteine desulfhydrase